MKDVPIIQRVEVYVLGTVHLVPPNVAAMKDVPMELSREEFVLGTVQRKERLDIQNWRLPLFDTHGCQMITFSHLLPKSWLYCNQEMNMNIIYRIIE